MATPLTSAYRGCSTLLLSDMSASTLLYIFCCRTLSYPTRTRPEFRFRYRFRWNLGWFRSGTGRFDRYQTGTTIFFMLDYRFSMFLLTSYLYHVLPSSSQTVSRAIPSSSQTVSRHRVLNQVHPSSSQTVSRAIPSSSQTVSRHRVLSSSSQAVSRHHVLPSSSQTV